MVIEIENIPEQKIRSYADEAWKESLHLYFKDFMELCWPKAYKEIDWSKKPEFLEQELRKIMPEDKLNQRVADKIVQIWLLNGKTAFIILHIELQGSGISKARLVERMMIYRYRIYDRYRTQVASLAILIDDSPTWRPDTYISELWDSVWLLKFPILKILDFRSQKETLINHPNPFAIVILAQLGVIETSGNFDRRLKLKIHLTRLLFEKGWDKKKILDFYKFMDGLLTLPKDLKIEYNVEVKKIEEEKKVSYITTAEWVGLERGHKEGLKEGLVQGRVEGRKEGEDFIFLSILESKFKNIPDKYLSMIPQVDENQIVIWSKRIVFANTLEDIFCD
jgi:hypothetical protein